MFNFSTTVRFVFGNNRYGGKNVEYAPKSQLSPQWVSEMIVLALNTTLL